VGGKGGGGGRGEKWTKPCMHIWIIKEKIKKKEKKIILHEKKKKKKVKDSKKKKKEVLGEGGVTTCKMGMTIVPFTGGKRRLLPVR
jgi:hypothetical protein